MRRIGFAATEVSPITRGGAGVLISEVARLLRERGDDVRIVLAAAPDRDRADDGGSVVFATPAEAPGWEFPFMDQSMAVAEELSRLHRQRPFDVVEVQDFDGLGFWLLTHRRDLGFGDTALAVRFHGPVDCQIEAMGATTPELDIVAAMERETFKMADRVIVPTEAIIPLVTQRYGVAPERIAVGAPPVRVLGPTRSWAGTGCDLLVIGRLSEVKGSHDMVRAVIPVMRTVPELSVTFVGADGWSITANESMRSWLENMVPSDLEDRFRFLDHLPPEQVVQLVADSLAVVAPSRFESFNLGVHEARAIGAPVVVPDLPAFEGVLDESTGALVFDGSVEGLSDAIERLATDPDLAARLGATALPLRTDPLTPYTSMPDVRHEREQGGVATAALARVEEIRFASSQPSRVDRLTRAVIRAMPRPAVRALKSLMPRPMRTVLKDRSGWDRIRQEKNWEDRWNDLVRHQSKSGPLPDPRTSVIIPCFNQGPFIRQALISVFSQTDGDLDAIIVDDGSTEQATIDILSSLDLPRVRVMRQPNRGLPAARNTGIAATDAEFVVTLDADDMLTPSYVHTLVGALETHPEAGYAHCWAELFGDFEAIWATRRPNPYQLMLTNSVVGCVLMRRHVWAAVGGYDESLRSGNEDWDLWIRLGAAGWHGTRIPEPLFRYRKHGVSMSVDTESDHATALSALTGRLPDLYARSHLAEVKKKWYPLVSILSTEPIEAPSSDIGSDVQFVVASTVDEGLGSATGKYVVLLDRRHRVDGGSIREMCRILESEPGLGSVTTLGPTPIRVVRTWSIFDPAAPNADRIVALDGTSEQRLSPNSHPSPEWMVPRTIDGLPVQRQHPEEPGAIPDWVPA
ncbi:MAG: glycosyltransferase [Acidimicrobiia bacterium]